MVGIRLLSHKSPRSSIHTMFSLCGVFGEVIQRTREVTTCMHSLTTREREIDFGCIAVRPFVGQYQQQSNREAKQGGEHKLFVDFLEENVRAGANRSSEGRSRQHMGCYIQLSRASDLFT